MTLPLLPAELSFEQRERLLELSRESTRQIAPLVVDRYLLRHWCEAFEDHNPAYLNDEAARALGHAGAIAPLGAVVSTFAQAFRWPPAAAEGHVHFAVKDALRVANAIVSAVEVEQHAALTIGDRLSITQRLLSVSARKQTRLGEGYFWVTARHFRNQRDELVVSLQTTAFGYGEQSAADGAPAGRHAPVEQALGEIVACDRTFVGWQDILPGRKIGAMIVPVTQLRAVYIASATRDFSPQHVDPAWARERAGAADVFVSTPFVIGMVCRYLTDWAGPRALVRRVAIAMGRSICAGEEMKIEGRVAAKHELRQEVDVDIAIYHADRVAITCSATVCFGAALDEPEGDAGERGAV